MAVAEQASAPKSAPRSERTPLGDAFRQLLKNKLAVGSTIFIIILVSMAIFAPFLNGYYIQGHQAELDRTNQPAYAKQTLQDNNAVPGTASDNPRLQGFTYWMGADNVGRDIWSRVLYGTRVSLAVALVASSVSLVLGVSYGLIAGYVGGRIDEFMMRIVDFLYGVPSLIVVILLQVYFKAITRRGEAEGLLGALVELDQALGGLFFVFVAFGALNWLSMARLARGQTLALKQKEFVEAAKATGVKPGRIIFRQILPNILGPCIVQETLQIPNYILAEAFLSFIGLGVNAPTPSWGIMINESYEALRSYPHQIVWPALALTVTVLAFNFLGDGLRDAFDPRLRE